MSGESVPSRFVYAVCVELNIPYPTDSDVIMLYFQWKDELDRITELMASANIHDAELNQA